MKTVSDRWSNSINNYKLNHFIVKQVDEKNMNICLLHGEKSKQDNKLISSPWTKM